MQSVKRFWTDPVWSKVIAAGILAVLAGMITRLLGWWPGILRGIAIMAHWLGARGLLPNWLAIVLLVVVAANGVAALRRFFRGLAATAADGPHWSEYTTDVFLGLRWRWKVADNVIVDICAFCPSCDLQVRPRNASTFASVDRVDFKCDNCDRVLATFEEPYEVVEDRATRFVQQRLRTDAWKTSVLAQSGVRAER